MNQNTAEKWKIIFTRTAKGGYKHIWMKTKIARNECSRYPNPLHKINPKGI